MYWDDKNKIEITIWCFLFVYQYLPLHLALSHLKYDGMIYYFNFSGSGRNPVVSPFKCDLFGSAFTEKISFNFWGLANWGHDKELKK